MTPETPPHNLDAEKAVLGSMLSYAPAVEVGLENLKRDDFYLTAHRHIFEAVYELYRKNTPIDLITVSEHLDIKGETEKAGGAEYIASLIGEVPSNESIAFYVSIVKDKSVLRQLVQVSYKIRQDCVQYADNVEGLLDMVQQDLFNLAQDKTSKDFVKIDKILLDTYKKISEMSQNGSAITGIPTGFADLDKITHGLQRSDLIILAARPAVGKTSFVLNLALNIGAVEKIPVGVFSLEMPKEQVVMRMLSQYGEINMGALRSGMVSEYDISKLGQSTAFMSAAPIYVDDTPNLTILEVRTKARRLKNEADIQLLIIDYLQLMASDIRVESRQQEISRISRNLKILARDLNIPIIALSQLSRAVEQRTDKRPMLSDLRESGAIEQDADIVMFLHKPDVEQDDPERRQRLVELIIGKHRNGQIGSVDLVFQEEYTRFRDCTRMEAPSFD